MRATVSFTPVTRKTSLVGSRWRVKRRVIRVVAVAVAVAGAGVAIVAAADGAIREAGTAGVVEVGAVEAVA